MICFYHVVRSCSSFQYAQGAREPFPFRWRAYGGSWEPAEGSQVLGWGGRPQIRWGLYRRCSSMSLFMCSSNPVPELEKSSYSLAFFIELWCFRLTHFFHPIGHLKNPVWVLVLYIPCLYYEYVNLPTRTAEIILCDCFYCCCSSCYYHYFSPRRILYCST